MMCGQKVSWGLLMLALAGVMRNLGNEPEARKLAEDAYEAADAAVADRRSAWDLETALRAVVGDRAGFSVVISGEAPAAACCWPARMDRYSSWMDGDWESCSMHKAQGAEDPCYFSVIQNRGRGFSNRVILKITTTIKRWKGNSFG